MKVTIFSDTLVRRLFSNEQVLGLHVRFGGGPWYTIVGIAGAVKHAGLAAWVPFGKSGERQSR